MLTDFENSFTVGLGNSKEQYKILPPLENLAVLPRVKHKSLKMLQNCSTNS